MTPNSMYCCARGYTLHINPLDGLLSPSAPTNVASQAEVGRTPRRTSPHSSCTRELPGSCCMRVCMHDISAPSQPGEGRALWSASACGRCG